MTLILSAFSSLGIAMAADSALTVPLRKPDGTIGDKVYYGTMKLFAIPKLMAGIAYWGWGDIPHPGADWLENEKLERTELWLPHFLEKNKEKYESIKDVALLLEDELRKRIPIIDLMQYPFGYGGMHLAGYEFVNEKSTPTFWHIHNGKSQELNQKKIDPSIVNANNDIPFDVTNNVDGARIDGKSIIEGKAGAILRNGDIEDYVALYELIFKPDSFFSKIVAKSGLTFPYVKTLTDLVDLLEFQIQTIAGLHKFSKEGGGIGGRITKLTINPTGIVTLS